MPEYIRKESITDKWNAVQNKTALPAGNVCIVDDKGGFVFAETKDPLTAVRSASMPEIAQLYNATVLNPRVLIGVFLGCMATFVFCAMTMKAVGRAAFGMVEEVRRQFRENPGIMDGSVTPDYKLPVAISTRAAQRAMILPSLMGIVTPIIVGLLLGVGGVLGLLVGTLCCGFCVAIFMSNAGGAWDNAKKYIEAGNFGGKGSDRTQGGGRG